MENQKWVNATNTLVKQGNSFCVRMPKHVVEELGAKEGDIICLRATKLKLGVTPEILKTYLDNARKLSSLKEFSDEKIMALSVLAYSEGMFLMEFMKKKGKNYFDIETLDDTKGPWANEMKIEQKKYRENIKKEFGDKFYKDYNYLMSEFAKHSKKN